MKKAIVCALAALALAVLPPLVRLLFLGLPAAWGTWIYRALTFLVISCPCALVISIPLSFFAGIGGGVYAHYMTAMIPTNFNFNYSAELLSEVIIGGTGSLTGSIIGAAFLSSLPELMRDFSTYRMLAYSVVLVLVMLFRPGGIFGRWEFSLTRLLGRLAHPKAKAKKGA